MSDDHPALEKFVAQAGSLYSPPTVALEILQLTGQPKVDLAALKQCLLRDPALVGRILRVVNSSLFGLSREVADLGQALALLGTKSVRLLVLGFSLPDELFLGLAGDILERYWHHTLIKASAAREISETIYRIPGEEPFIAGLLQDIGILVLLQQLGEPYARFLDRALAKEVNVDAAEAVALGFEHEQLSARLLAKWGLPQSLVAAIAIGRSAEQMDRLPLANRAMPQILHMAHLVAGLLTEGRADCLGELERVGRHYRQITSIQISSIVAALQSKVEQLADVLSLELPAGVDYQSIFHDAHRQLSAAAEDAALALAVPEPITANETAAIEEQICSASTALTEAATQFLQTVPSNYVSTARTKVTANSTAEFSSARSVTFVQAAAQQTPPLPVTEFRSPQLSKSDSSDSIPGNRLAEHVQTAIAACRQAREPLSLVLIQLDRFHDVTRRVGTTESKRFVQLLGLLCGRTEHAGIVQLQTGESSLALVLPNCDRPAAGEIGHHLLRDVRRLREQHADLADAQLSVSIGVATIAMPAKNFSPASLIDSARRCLNAAQLSGGNAVKSIDVL